MVTKFMLLGKMVNLNKDLMLLLRFKFKQSIKQLNKISKQIKKGKSFWEI